MTLATPTKTHLFLEGDSFLLAMIQALLQLLNLALALRHLHKQQCLIIKNDIAINTKVEKFGIWKIGDSKTKKDSHREVTVTRLSRGLAVASLRVAVHR